MRNLLVALAAIMLMSASLGAQTTRSTTATGPGSGPATRSVPPGVRAIYDIEYARPKAQDKKHREVDRPLLMDIYLPEKAQGPLPLIIWVHGGGWTRGARSPNNAVGFVEQGFAVAAVSYRFSWEALWPAAIHDVKAAVRYLRANAAKYSLDPKRFGAFGNSAGGHLVAVLGTSGAVKELEGEVGGNLDHSSSVQAVVDWCGPSDFFQLGDPAQWKLAVDCASALVGGQFEKNKDRVVSANPITHITKDDPPFLIMHGDADKIVPVSQSQLLHDALTKAGVSSELHVIKGAPHGLGDDQSTKTVGEFFVKVLKPAAVKQ